MRKHDVGGAESFVEIHRQERIRLEELRRSESTCLLALRKVVCTSQLRRLFSWACPTKEALSAIQEWQRNTNGREGVVDCGSGTGVWAELLRQRNVKIAAYDTNLTGDEGENAYHTPSGEKTPAPPFALVRQAEAAVAASSHSARLLLLCWPSPEKESRQAIDALENFSGDVVSHVGVQGDEWKEEPETAGPEFFRLLRSEWSLASSIALPSLTETQEVLSIWTRRQNRKAATGEEPIASNAVAMDGERSRRNAAKRRALLHRQLREWSLRAAWMVASRRIGGGKGPSGWVEQEAIAKARVEAGPIAWLGLKVLAKA